MKKWNRDFLPFYHSILSTGYEWDFLPVWWLSHTISRVAQQSFCHVEKACSPSPWLQQLPTGCHSSKTWPRSVWIEMVIQGLCCGNTTFPLGMLRCLGTGRITGAHGLQVPVALGPLLNFLHQSPSILPLVQPNLVSETAPFLLFPPLSRCPPTHTCTFPFP